MDDDDAALRTHGFCVLRGLLPTGLIDALRVAHAPLLAAAMRRPESANRGPMRWYLDLPFAPPFADARVYEHPRVLALVEREIGADPLILHYGSDSPAAGSVDQEVHADYAPLFPELAAPVPPPAITVNIPLVDVDACNGPFEIARGTHRLARDEARRRVGAGEIALEPVHLRRGDVLVRDPGALHRGTANRSPDPRPVIVVAFQRPWYRHGEMPAMPISAAQRALLSPRGERLLRLHLERAAAAAI